MKKIKTMLVLAALIGFTATGLTACNTVEGLGQDTRALGDAITGASRDTRGY
mgnify:CR=1 FL=1